MASSTPHTILTSDTDPYQYEAPAAAAIMPGDLIERESTGDVQRHSTANGNAAPMFALENPFSDHGGTTAAIDHAYAADETVFHAICRPGDRVYAWLDIGGSVANGTFLSSAGSIGALQAYAGGTALAPDRVVAKALETVDNSGGSAKARIEVEVV
jgi:hypothetical protein